MVNQADGASLSTAAARSLSNVAPDMPDSISPVMKLNLTQAETVACAIMVSLAWTLAHTALIGVLTRKRLPLR